MSERNDRARRREQDEPDELQSPVPRPLAAIAIVMMAWGTWYYFQNTGYPVAAGDRRTPVAAVSAGSVDGSTVYAGNCAACHQANGMGLSGVFPPLAGSRWVLENDARLVQILLHGINGEIEVLGVTYRGVMPAFPQLADAELAAVLTYIRSNWGNDAPPIPADEVAAGRDRFPERQAAWDGGAELDRVFPPDGT